MNQELVRIIDNLARDKNIDKESIFLDLESAMASAVRKDLGNIDSDIVVRIERSSGSIYAAIDGKVVDIRQLGRIAAQTAKQVMIQKIKSDERTSIFTEFKQRRGEIVNGVATRFEGGVLVVNLNNRTEAVLPKSESISGETHHIGDRVRAIILDVREVSSQIKIVLSRTHPDFIKKLFELEVPEVTEGIIEIKGLAREAGYRTKMSVFSSDDKVDPVGACVGIRGSRIKNIVDELGGEKIDIVRWSDSSQVLISNALAPSKVSEIALCFEVGKATVVVEDDQLSLAIGKHGQNVRLAARLTGWDIDILTPDEYNKEVEKLTEFIGSIEGIDDSVVDKLLAIGIINILDLEEVGVEPLVNEIGVDPETASRLISCAVEKSKEIAAKSLSTKAQEVLNKEQKSMDIKK